MTGSCFKFVALANFCNATNECRFSSVVTTNSVSVRSG